MVASKTVVTGRTVLCLFSFLFDLVKSGLFHAFTPCLCRTPVLPQKHSHPQPAPGPQLLRSPLKPQVLTPGVQAPLNPQVLTPAPQIPPKPSGTDPQELRSPLNPQVLTPAPQITPEPSGTVPGPSGPAEPWPRPPRLLPAASSQAPRSCCVHPVLLGTRSSCPHSPAPRQRVAHGEHT